uniref:Glyoxalase domain-containing protein 4 n=1 Tax=Amphilophus citrinellus TaxID=61819 RepID=A0A3Q0RJU4_AMPCI
MGLTPSSIPDLFLSKGSSRSRSTVLKNTVCGLAPASRASQIKRLPSRRILPWCSRNVLERATLTNLLPSTSFFVTLKACFVADCASLLALTASLSVVAAVILPLVSFWMLGSSGDSTLTGFLRSPRTYRLDSTLTLLLYVRKAFRSIVKTRHITLFMYAAIFCLLSSSLVSLHFVFKVGDRAKTAIFYRDVLGMKVLRHEEFEEGCKATCNGPYDGKWSKTMIGFGPEDDHFVAELTYNYGVGEYQLGNDFLGLTLQSSQAVSNAKRLGWPLTEVGEALYLTQAPGGYPFYLVDKEQPLSDPVQKVCLGVSDLQRSTHYWSTLLGMTVMDKNEEKKTVLMGFADTQCKLELRDIGATVDHGTAFGRIAFSCPREQLPDIEALMKKENQKILTPLVSLDTPGKATVEVVILADPDGHEICFVGDEAFRQLSMVDPKGNELLDKAMAEDKSDEWFAKHNKQKAAA